MAFEDEEALVVLVVVEVDVDEVDVDEVELDELDADVPSEADHEGSDVVVAVVAGVVDEVEVVVAELVVVDVSAADWRATAIPVPRPRKIATLERAVARRARRAGWARRRTGSRSDWSGIGTSELVVVTTMGPIPQTFRSAARERRKKPADSPAVLGSCSYDQHPMADVRPALVLVAEDDKGVRDSLARALRLEGYEVQAVRDGAEALAAVTVRLPDLVVLDVMMPGVDGLTACRQLRARHRTLPILMLTARREVRDRVAGLDAGADDYLVKPYAVGELAARLRALLRRTSVSGAETALRVGDVTLDPGSRLAERAGRPLDLTKTEFDLLELLMHNTGIVLTRDTIYERIWGYDFETSSRSLDVYIGYLRQKTEAGGAERLIHTVRGIGYVMRPT